jgi:hypothetical protein
MGWQAYAAIAAASAVSSYFQSQAEAKAGKEAAEIQSEAGYAAIAEQRRQFDAIQKLLKPYIEAGNTSLTSQLALLGLGGEEAQQKAISGIEQSPLFKTLARQGEESLLQNASATGGVRGGNTARILAEYRPTLLKNEIESQYSKLAGLTNVGQAAAAGQAAYGAQNSGNIGNILTGIGTAGAQSALLSGLSQSKLYGNIGNAAGLAAYGYFNQPNNPPQTTAGAAGGAVGGSFQ